MSAHGRLGRICAAAATLALACACAVGPNYKRPVAAEPPAFKEQLTPEGQPSPWKPAEPAETTPKGKWWEIFGDPQLNALEEQVDVSNQNIAQAEAQFRAARAAVRGARSDFYPTVTTSPSVTRGQVSATNLNPRPPTTNLYLLPVDASYEVDAWGRVRRTVESSVALAQATAADLETIRLSMHAELAVDYFALQGLDVEKKLLDDNVVAYEKALQLTLNRYHQGVVSGVDVAQAQTQLETTRAQATDLELTRAQFEHAIAVLIGKAPAEFELARSTTVPAPPVVPLELPSQLLERRPDIAASERRVASANAEIGVATAAFFPRLLLTASGGYGASSLTSFFSLPNRFWSIGAMLAQTLFQGGKIRAGKEQAEANYDASVATYRLQVLTAFQDVEDNLAALKILAVEAQQQAAAVDAAERAQIIANNRYEGGVTTYLEVITAQAVALNNQRTAIELSVRRLAAAVNLIKGLGGGWDPSTLPYGAPPPAPAAGESAEAVRPAASVSQQ